MISLLACVYINDMYGWISTTTDSVEDYVLGMRYNLPQRNVYASIFEILLY